VPKHPEITVKLVGADGNAIAIIGSVVEAMRTAKLPDEEISQFRDEAMSLRPSSPNVREVGGGRVVGRRTIVEKGPQPSRPAPRCREILHQKVGNRQRRLLPGAPVGAVHVDSVPIPRPVAAVVATTVSVVGGRIAVAVTIAVAAVAAVAAIAAIVAVAAIVRSGQRATNQRARGKAQSDAAKAATPAASAPTAPTPLRPAMKGEH
jgi:hypothetical protein